MLSNNGSFRPIYIEETLHRSMLACRYKEMKNEYDVGHMTKMVAMPIYGKTTSKIFSETSGPISTKLDM